MGVSILRNLPEEWAANRFSGIVIAVFETTSSCIQGRLGGGHQGQCHYHTPLALIS